MHENIIESNREELCLRTVTAEGQDWSLFNMSCLWVLISSFYAAIPWLPLSSFSCFSFITRSVLEIWFRFYSVLEFPSHYAVFTHYAVCFCCCFFLLVQVFSFVIAIMYQPSQLVSTHQAWKKKKKKRTHKQQQKTEKTSRHKQHNALPDGAVGALQFCSSELSPQSSAPSQIQSLLTHAPLAQVIWNDLHGHFSSSELSKQSYEPSHRHAFLMQLPSLHWNWLGKQGVAVVIVGTGVEGSVFAFVVTGSGVRWWLFDNAIKRRNLFKCNAIQCSTRTMVLNLSKLPYAVGEESAKFGNIDRQMNNRVGF